jgi:23S rRNA pseudouridine2605 synthase
MTAPARIRLLRDAENPWYELVLIEGRNREIRKMFEEVGYHVEKIRRVGYGPLILDLEPGRMRELTLEEVEKLRRAAAGKSPKPEKKMPRPGRTRPQRASDRPAPSGSRPKSRPGTKSRPARRPR